MILQEMRQEHDIDVLLIKTSLVSPQVPLQYSSQSGWGLRAFLRWWPPSAVWVGPLIFFI